LFFVNDFARGRTVCVGSFGGDVELLRNPQFAALVSDGERCFDTSVAALGARVENIKRST
jgi:hypothetical protein